MVIVFRRKQTDDICQQFRADDQITMLSDHYEIYFEGMGRSRLEKWRKLNFSLIFISSWRLEGGNVI